MMSVTKLYRFSASHRLHSPELSDVENDRLYGKCNNPFGHGHDYILEITVAGVPDETTGLILRISELDQVVEEQILNLFSHRNINVDVPLFRNVVPTTENVVIAIMNLLEQHWRSYIENTEAHLHRVRIRETDRNSFKLLADSKTGAEPMLREKENVNVND